MFKIRVSCALAALIAGAALSCAPAGAHPLPTMFLPPRVQIQPVDPQMIEPQTAQPYAVEPEENENAQLPERLQRQVDSIRLCRLRLDRHRYAAHVSLL